MSKFSIKFIIFTALFGAYYLQGVLYPTGSVVSLIIGLSFLLFGIFYYAEYIFFIKHRVTFINIYAVFYFLLATTFIISPKIVIGFTALPTLDQFKSSSFAILPLFIGYIIGMKRKIPDKQILLTYICFLIICCLRFVLNGQLTEDNISPNSEEVTNNAAYNFISLLVFIPVLFRKHRLLCTAAIVISVIFVIAGAKRGAIICMALIFIYSIYFYKQNFGLSLRSLIIITTAVSLLFGFFTYSLEQNSYLQKRFDDTLEGDSSGRDDIALTLWKSYERFDITNQLFGQGTAQTVNFAGNYAHNDWMELLINNGILGVMIYLLFFITILKYSRRAPIILKLTLNIFVIILFCKSMFSMGYSSAFDGLSLLMIGVLVGNNEKHNLLNRR